MLLGSNLTVGLLGSAFERNGDLGSMVLGSVAGGLAGGLGGTLAGPAGTVLGVPIGVGVGATIGYLMTDVPQAHATYIPLEEGGMVSFGFAF